MVGFITKEELDLLEKLSRVLEGLEGILKIQYLSDGVHDSGRLKLYYKNPKSLETETYTLALYYDEISITTPSSDKTLPQEIIKCINNKFPQSQYEKLASNVYIWHGATI